MNFARIRQLCNERNISITTLERECGLANGTVCKWQDEAQRPRVDTVKAVADYFKVTMDELVGEGSVNDG